MMDISKTVKVTRLKLCELISNTWLLYIVSSGEKWVNNYWKMFWLISQPLWGVEEKGCLVSTDSVDLTEDIDIGHVHLSHKNLLAILKFLLDILLTFDPTSLIQDSLNLIHAVLWWPRSLSICLIWHIMYCFPRLANKLLHVGSNQFNLLWLLNGSTCNQFWVMCADWDHELGCFFMFRAVLALEGALVKNWKLLNANRYYSPTVMTKNVVSLLKCQPSQGHSSW